MVFVGRPAQRYNILMPASEEGQQSLEKLREADRRPRSQIVDLLNARARVVVEIGKLKQQHNTPIYSPDREKMVLEKVRRLNQRAAAGSMPGGGVSRVDERVVRAGKAAADRFSRARPARFRTPRRCRNSAAASTHVPLSDIPSVFDEVVRGHIDYGLVPVENSIGGGIVDTLDAFLHSSAKICAEVQGDDPPLPAGARCRGRK